MKKFCLTTAIVVFLLFCLNGVQAQPVATNLDQLKLMEQFLGTWQMETGKDTFLVAEIQQYGKAFVETVYRTIKEKKTWSSIGSYSYSAKEGKFKIFSLNTSGSYATWIASFTSEKRWNQERVENFNPDKILRKEELVFETPTSLIVTYFNSDGIKTREVRGIKVK